MYKTITGYDLDGFDQQINDAENEGFSVIAFYPCAYIKGAYVDEFGFLRQTQFTALMHKPDPVPTRTGMTVEENISARVNAQAAASSKSALQNVAETLGGLWENVFGETVQPDAGHDALREEARQRDSTGLANKRLGG